MPQFSNTDKDVFVVKLDKMIDRGALLSRYSRAASLDIRDVYQKEFEGNENRGIEFYKRVFLEYGDESIAELVTAQIAVQNVSNVLTKVMEELRVGLSFIEKSSRYVRYDKKYNGRYLYLEPEKAGIRGNEAKDYDDSCQALFEFYASHYEDALKFYREKYPVSTIKFASSGSKEAFFDELDQADRALAEKSYTSSVRARALDDLRYLLPASTLTNMGISANGRSYVNLVQKLKSTGLPEANVLGDAIYSELQTELPELIDSALSRYGMNVVEYRRALDAFEPFESKSTASKPHLVELLDFEDRKKALAKSLSILGFANGYGDFQESYGSVSAMDELKLKSIIDNLAALRKNRRHKLHRAFESVSYLFQITTNYGAFRDLQRHRFISITRQPLSNTFGYDVPEYFRESSSKGEYTEIMEKTSQTYNRLKHKHGRQIAQYAVPYAYRYPVTAYLNLREIAFFTELRSTPQAHPDLREIAISIFRKVQEVHPELASLITFVDEGDYSLGRLKSEQRKEKKISELDNRNST